MSHPDSTVPPDTRQWLAAAGLAVKASYRVDEVARLLSMGERTIYTWIAVGHLKVLNTPPTPRRASRIPLDEIIRLHAED